MLREHLLSQGNPGWSILIVYHNLPRYTTVVFISLAQVGVFFSAVYMVCGHGLARYCVFVGGFCGSIVSQQEVDG